MAVITDENDTNARSTSNKTIKSVITGDTVTINIKNKPQYDYNFYGLVLECVNELPKFSDKSDSMIRRLLLIDMPSCFTGKEKKYIKESLIQRKDVREYVLKRVLIDMEYRENFTEPESSKKLLREFEEISNSVFAFCTEILPECKWDLLPAEKFLFAMYTSWCKRINPAGTPAGRNTFIKGVKKFVGDDKNNSEFEWTESTRSQGRMDWAEPLLLEYKIETFLNRQYSNSMDNSKICTPQFLNVKYSGLKRKIPSACNTATD